jgi:hypothetical protein
MPAPKGHQRYGGRAKGTKNKKDQVRPEVLDAALIKLRAQLPSEIRDMTPLEALVLVMHWAIAAGDRSTILAAVAAAAPYCHTRLASADLRIRDEHAGKTDEQLQAEIEELERRIKAAETLH